MVYYFASAFVQAWIWSTHVILGRKDVYQISMFFPLRYKVQYMITVTEKNSYQCSIFLRIHLDKDKGPKDFLRISLHYDKDS